jgi:hypothetical protein
MLNPLSIAVPLLTLNVKNNFLELHACAMPEKDIGCGIFS